MTKNKNPLLDRDFLKKLDQEKDKLIFARLIALTAEEYPIEQIEGRVTQGSINIDGASAVRRTCSLTLIGHDLKITDMNWAIRNKFKVEIGVQNLIDPNYPDIIWFNQGVYGISSFSFSESTTGHTVQISGKDKMVYLNGEFGGALTSSVRFDVEDRVLDGGVIESVKLPIYNIIKSALTQYAKEPAKNIIINDLDQIAYELWDNRAYYNEKGYPIYCFHETNGENKIKDITLNKDQEVYYYDDNEKRTIHKPLKNLPFESFYLRNELFETDLIEGRDFQIYEGSSNYKISKIDFGEAAGYHKTDLIYPGELVLNIGENITSLLDKLKNVLGEYEYFYNLDGKFVFQKKKTYVKGLFSPINGETIDPFYFNSKYIYEFKESDLITTYSNAPNFSELKNDFAVWGSRQSVSGQKIPIYARYAIDHKPTEYHCLDHYKRIKLIYLRMENVSPNVATDKIMASEAMRTWPENTILYEKIVKRDIKTGNIVSLTKFTPVYLQSNNKYWDFVSLAITQNSKWIKLNDQLTEEEKEQFQFEVYYYYPIEINTSYNGSSEKYDKNHCKIFEIKTDEFGQEFYEEFTNFETLYKEVNGQYSLLSSFENEYNLLTMQGFLSNEYWVQERASGNITTEIYDWREIIYIMAEDYMQHNRNINFKSLLTSKNPKCKDGKTGYEQYYTDILGFWRQIYNPNPSAEEIAKYNFMNEEEKSNSKLPITLIHFSKNVFETPTNINFWIDFLDTYGDLEKYSVPQIGDRIKAISEDSITTISYKTNPQIEFVIDHEEPAGTLNLPTINIPSSMKHIFNISSQGTSAQQRAEQLLYQHAICAETLTLNTIPIYYLEPNSLIYVENQENNIQGEYIISKIIIPLTYNGTMSITASKVIKNLK